MNIKTLKAVGILAVLAAFAWAGWEWRDRAADAELAQLELNLKSAQLEAARTARIIEAHRAHAEKTVARMAALRKQAREAKARTITKEVIKYVQAPIAERVVMPTGWVCIHDKAAGDPAGVPEDAVAACGADASPRRATDADSIVTVTENYAACYAWRDKLIALQEWVRASHGQ